MPFVDQLPALLGVVVGAVGSYAASSLTERGRWRRARTERWDNERFHSYARYAHLLKIQIHLAQRIGAARGLPRTGNPIDIEEGLAQLDEAETKRAAEWESVLLVGDAATVAAARTWHEAVWNVELYAKGMRNDPDGWVSAVGAMSRARDAFYASARRDLGIAGPPPPSGQWPRPWEIDEPAGSSKIIPGQDVG
ncbi:hypothetical protein AB0B45_20395 [Nonomuraea sp. NPDC049152]|uniref:hypothetical protein n=1 Tax=Nonomuraea sp. NPDC049152 TaxID=3154350 RepID=UPI0033CEDEDA